MSESEFNQWVETSWRRNLTPAERERVKEWLARHPEASAMDPDWEWTLTQALKQLPPAPLSSHFTAQVLQMARREEAEDARSRPGLWHRWQAWVQRSTRPVIWAGAAVLFVVVGLQQLQEHSRQEIARGVMSLSQAGQFAEVGASEDFEAIRQLSRVQSTVDPVDEELFVVLSAMNK